MEKHDTYLAALASGKKALNRQHTHQKLTTSRLVPENCTCVSQSGASFCDGIEHSFHHRNCRACDTNRAT